MSNSFAWREPGQLSFEIEIPWICFSSFLKIVNEYHGINMSTAIDQKTYLQKYLGGSSKDKKKKKEKKAIKGKGFKIIDDDLDLSKLRALETDELDIYGEGEDAPQVAGIIDDRPEELKKLEQFKTSTKWRVINQDDGFNSKIQIEEIKKSVKEVEKENEIIFGKMYSDSEDENEKDTKKQNDDSDASPPRKNALKKGDNSPRKSRKQSDSDASPPRRNASKKQSDHSSARNKASKKQYDSDISPPRKSKKQNNDSDASPPRKQTSTNRRDSPPRKNTSTKQNYDKQPRKESKKQYDSDASPPRKRDRSPRKETTHESRKRERAKKPSRWGDFEFEKNEVEMISQEYEKKKTTSPNRHDSDESPPRKRDKDRSDRERSRKDRKSERDRSCKSDSDPSPPRRKDQKRTEQKRKHDSDSDLSPPRKNDRSKKRSSDSPPPTNKKMAKTLEGKMAGLQDAKQLRMENDSFRQREEEVFNRMADEVSGRNAHVVSRKGKRETSEDRNKQREKAERQKEIDDKYKKWSRGLKQIEDHQERMQEYMHEASKPLARHRGDKDLESQLKGVERAGDPMLDYIRERKRETGQLPPERPSYKGSFPPNRFNIRPGYRWDGVDRSNGYEKKYFEQQSKRKAQEEEAYKWSTEDL